jgi:hypothetical protein
MEACPRRPLVLLGHSMGGIVIAKALCLAERDSEQWPDTYESITSCVFFGTPFNGTPVADIAIHWAKAKEQSGIGIAVDSQLLDLLRPGNESLRELKRDFIRASGKLAHRVQLYCFYEMELTNWDEIISKLTSENFPPELVEKLNSQVS